MTVELPQVAADDSTREIRKPVDETAVMPKVPAADETAVLPKVEPKAVPVEDRVPPGLFRDETPASPVSPAETTRELPVAEPRPRPSWAEETPMDDLPSLTDTLLGSREEWAQWQTEEPNPDENPRKRRS